MPSVLVLASAGSDTVDPPKETVAESAENMKSAPGKLVFRQLVLDYHQMMPLFAEAAGAAGAKQYTLQERPARPLFFRATQSAAEGLRLCQ